jgi:hypothetical protein
MELQQAAAAEGTVERGKCKSAGGETGHHHHHNHHHLLATTSIRWPLFLAAFILLLAVLLWGRFTDAGFCGSFFRGDALLRKGPRARK